MFYKVVEGLVQAIDPTDYIQEIRSKRQVKANNFSDFQYTNIKDKKTEIADHTKLIDCKTDNRKNYHFFYKNNSSVVPSIEENIACQKTVEGYTAALHWLV